MSDMDAMRSEIEKILKDERWRGFVSGKVEGALNVLYLLDLDKEKRVELLQEAVGLSRATAEEFIEPKENEEKILKNKNLTGADKS